MPSESSISQTTSTPDTTIKGILSEYNTTLTPKIDAKIPKMGLISGGTNCYEECETAKETTLTINGESKNEIFAPSTVTSITVQKGKENEAWTKAITIEGNGSNPTVNFENNGESSWNWIGGITPTITPKSLLLLHWCSKIGVAQLIPTSAS